MNGEERLSPPSEPEQFDSTDGSSAAKSKAPSQATRLVGLAEELFYLHRASGGELFAVPRSGARIVRLFGARSGDDSLRSELARFYCERYGAVPSQGSLSDALRVLEGRAASAPLVPLYLRVGWHGDAVVVDFGDETGRAIVVSPDGWQIVPEAPVYFRRTPLTERLPEPERGGRLDELRELLHVDDDSWQLVVGWLVTTVIPDMGVPILLLRGQQGAGKSSSARMLVRLVDPSAAPLRSAPRERDWHAAGSASHVLALDNLSRLPEWLGDALCRVVDGEAVAIRSLYTTGDLSVFRFRVAVILTGIAVEGVRGDLGDRLLPIELERLGEDERRVESELEDAFRECHPRLLGALLDLLAQVLRVLPEVKPERLPRLAEAARTFAAVDRVFGTSSFDGLMRAARAVAADVVEDDPVAAALVELVDSTGEWTGSCRDLLNRITPGDSDDAIRTRAPRGWPETPQALGSHLARLREPLRLVGIACEQLPRTKSSRPWRIRQIATSESRGQETSQPSSASFVAQPGHFSGDGGGDDLPPDLAHRVTPGDMDDMPSTPMSSVVVTAQNPSLPRDLPTGDMGDDVITSSQGREERGSLAWLTSASVAEIAEWDGEVDAGAAP